MEAEKRPKMNFGEENICPVCGSSNIKVEIEYLKDNKNIQKVSKTCDKCKTNWGYLKYIKTNHIDGLFIFYDEQ